MLTEDDTFRKLKRPTYWKMRDIWVDSELFKCQVRMGNGPRPTNYLELLDKFFNDHGWTVEEYSFFRHD